MSADQQTPSQGVIKQLFARSGNRCAFPRCTTPLFDGTTLVGEICHIKAARPNGPRYDPNQTPGERHGYANLLLLCPTHHKVVDDDPIAYSVERLMRMKAEHESKSLAPAEEDIDRATRLLVDQSVTAVNQSGGIAAHTVHQTINVHPPIVDPGAARRSVIARIRQFHDERCAAVRAGAAPVRLLTQGTLVLHVVPFAAVDTRRAPAFSAMAQQPDRFVPIDSPRAADFRTTYDGLLVGSNAKGLAEAQRAYVLVFQSGAVEAVASSLARGHGHDLLEFPRIEAMLIAHVRQYLRSLRDFGIEPPIDVLLSLMGVKGMRFLHHSLAAGVIPEDIPYGPLEHDHLDFVEVVLEDYPRDDAAAAEQLRPLLQHLASAAGLPYP